MSEQTPESIPVMGPIEESCRREINALKLTGPLSNTLAESAINLSRALDTGNVNSVAMVSRELRETLKALSEATEDADDSAKLQSELSAPVRNSKD